MFVNCCPEATVAWAITVDPVLIWRTSPALHRLDEALGHHWAWAGSIALGLVLALWIVYEWVVMPETTWLQPALLLVGLSMAGLPSLPSMRRWFAVRSDAETRRSW